MKRALLVCIFSAMTSLFATTANSAVISVVGNRSELDTISTAFTSYGDTVTRFNTGWSSLSNAQLDTIFASDIVWEGDIFAAIPGDVQSRMINFVNANHGLMLTAERPCCDAHNASVQSVGRTLTSDNALLVGQDGIDYFNHSFSNSPTTILTSPNDVRGQPAQHNGPGRVQPTGGVSSDACFIVSSSPSIVCTAAAWGPDVLLNNVGRLIIYGDINSQPSLVTNFNGDQFENMRQFLLTGFSGGGDVCLTNPNLPGCIPPPSSNGVPEPASLALLSLGFGALCATRRRKVI